MPTQAHARAHVLSSSQCMCNYINKLIIARRPFGYLAISLAHPPTGKHQEFDWLGVAGGRRVYGLPAEHLGCTRQSQKAQGRVTWLSERVEGLPDVISGDTQPLMEALENKL